VGPEKNSTLAICMILLPIKRYPGDKSKNKAMIGVSDSYSGKFDILFTVHLSIILAIDQLNTQILV